MKVGKYQIGRFHAIIKKTYNDSSISYETQFSSNTDLMESVYALRQCVGEVVGIATDSPKVLSNISVIQGKENIIKELE